MAGPILWAGRHWALPVLTALAPSERYYRRRGRSHQKLTAVLDLLHFCQSLRQPVTFITRLRLDAGLYAPAPQRLPGQTGRPRVKRVRLPTLKKLLNQPAVSWTTAPVAVWYHSGKPPVPIRWVLVRDPEGEFESQALLCTDPGSDSGAVLEWFALRWQLGVTFQEVPSHLGVETQRQWSGRAIARTTPD